MRVIIPTTAMMGRYRKLRKQSAAKRLRYAEELLDHPERLAEDFASSVARFRSYGQVDFAFAAPRLTRAADEMKRSGDIALPLEVQRTLTPTDGPARLDEHDAGAAVTPVPAARLACTFVDRELLVQRTRNPAQWENGRANGGGVRVDVLLADAADRTPIVGEVKLPGDMDPFFALIEALTCTAHLATPNQYERLRRQLAFPALEALTPRLDVAILHDDRDGTYWTEPPRGRNLAELEAATTALAPRLLAQDGIAASVRRITKLVLARDAHDAITAQVAWAWERSSAA